MSSRQSPGFAIPYVAESTRYGERVSDIYSRLLRDRIIFITDPIEEQLANSVVAQLIFLDYEDPERDINIYIQSPGGSVTAGLAIYDTMQYVRPDVATICVGQTASMATVLLAAGAPGKRLALPSARMHMHPAWIGQIGGYAPDIDVHARQLLRTQAVVRGLLAKHTGQSIEKIAEDSQRDFFMDAAQAVEYGLVDGILTSQSKEAGAAKPGLNGRGNGAGHQP